VDSGKPQEAESLLRDALLTRRDLSAPAWSIAEAESILGACLSALVRYEEAEVLLLASYEKVQAGSGYNELTQRRDALNRLITLYEQWAKPDQALRYRTLLRQEPEA
jgi:hypothetical protein